MSIVFQYVFRQAVSSLLLILASLGGVVWIALALKQLNLVTAQGQSAWVLLQMTTLALPNLLAFVAPFALLIAAIQTLNRLNTDSELIVLTAAGATSWNVAKPLLVLALIVTFVVGFVNHVGMPWSLQLLRAYVIEVRTDLLAQVIQPGRFSTPEVGLTFHIRERSRNGELHGLLINDTRDKNQAQAYLAERGRIIKQDKSAFMIMTNGHILRQDDGDRPSQIIQFDRYMIDLDRFDKNDSSHVDLKARERYLFQLMYPEKESALYKAKPGRFHAELHERFSNPLYPIAFVLIALAAVGQAQSTRQNSSERMVYGFAAAISCRLGGLAVNNMSASSDVFLPGLYFIPLAAIGVSLVVIRRNLWPRSSSFSLFDFVNERGAGLLLRLRGGKQAADGDLLASETRGSRL